MLDIPVSKQHAALVRQFRCRVKIANVFLFLPDRRKNLEHHWKDRRVGGDCLKYFYSVQSNIPRVFRPRLEPSGHPQPSFSRSGGKTTVLRLEKVFLVGDSPPSLLLCRPPLAVASAAVGNKRFPSTVSCQSGVLFFWNLFCSLSI